MKNEGTGAGLPPAPDTEKMSGKGYIKISRDIDTWEYLDKPLAYALWNHLLRMAAWKDTEDLKRGEIITSIRDLSKISGIYRHGISEWLSVFEEAGQIRVERSGKMLKITLLNYEKYNAEPVRKRAGNAEPTGQNCDQSKKSLGRNVTSTGQNCDQSKKSLGRNVTSTGQNCDQSEQVPSLYYENNETDILCIKNRNNNTRECVKTEVVENQEIWFREFWKSYPKHKAKADAEKAFRKKCRSEQKYNEIMAGLRRFNQTEWKNIDPRFIPYPATWLNGERWTDDADIDLKSRKSANIHTDALRQIFGEDEKGENHD